MRRSRAPLKRPLVERGDAFLCRWVACEIARPFGAASAGSVQAAHEILKMRAVYTVCVEIIARIGIGLALERLRVLRVYKKRRQRRDRI